MIKGILTSRNPLFIGSSLRTSASSVRHAEAGLSFVVIPFSSGQVFGPRPNGPASCPRATLVVIPFSSGQVFGPWYRVRKHRKTESGVVIPFSSGQVFGRRVSTSLLCKGHSGRNPLFIGSSLRTLVFDTDEWSWYEEFSRNPLFIGSSLRTEPAQAAHARGLQS